ncbi:hypothetical protein SARC_02813 [Sphaeroforma arctica JP610]|uniref:RING-type domain-containing protein n=1 Tax=Sphaeroforma arctica JP610 TaxID=667725 RepID=A0A0L0G9Q4_9EUKA|nr:hypothetical protein SARC_02813 [Sphaeroforma arctica JP610]KNC84993.1 hypothetical protein SARC_02813 [Sphaeroforma arctica JP610]|eukprot:XP_014158895.1 hypothetical protein SARC_02813 [Sphaeroforma arctica JP610]
MNMIPKDEVTQAAKVLNRVTGDIIRRHSLYRKRFRILKYLLQQGRHDSIAWQLVDILFSADEDPVFLSTNMTELLVDHVYTTGSVSIHEILVVTDIVLDMELNESMAEILQRFKAAMETPLYVSERARMKAASIEVESFMYGPSAWSLDGLTNDHFHATDSDNEYSDVESNDETIGIDGNHIGCLRGNASNPDVIPLLPTIPTIRECHICKDHDTKHVSVKLPCADTFHQKCVRRWLQSSNSCPLCKNELPRESTVPIASTFEALDIPKHLPLEKVIRVQVVKNSLPNPESNESGYKDAPKIYFVDRKGVVISSEKKKNTHWQIASKFGEEWLIS